MTVQDAENAVARMFGDSETATASGLFGGKEDTVKVAARIRPMSAKEISMDPRQAVTQVGADGIRCAVSDELRVVTADWNRADPWLLAAPGIP